MATATRTMIARAGTQGAQEGGVSKHQAISLLTRSPHGDLAQYVPVGRQVAIEDPEFLAHLIAWNQVKGSVRDSKVALPVIQLSASNGHEEITENALAHLALLDPRNLLRAVEFGWVLKTPGSGKGIARVVERYLRERESRWPWWERTALQHRASMKSLYARFHVRPNAMADLILFKEEYPQGTVFAVVRELRTMPATEAASAIMEHKIPFLIAQGALGEKAKEPDLVLALIERMTPAELVTNSAALERLGVKTVPELRAAYEAAITRAADSKKAPAGGAGLKASRAAAAQKDHKMAEKLAGLQERQIESAKAAGEGIDGDWLVLGDKSASMEGAIEVARHVAGTLAKMVRGQVHLVFFDSSPRYMEVSGKSYDEICAMTNAVRASGQTSIGVGLQYAMEMGLSVQGIAIVSDAEENTPPMFANVYQRWAESVGSEPPVYLYRMGGDSGAFYDLARTMSQAGLEMQEFDLRGGVDYYSLPNVIRTMRVSRYSLTDEIMGTPLRTVDDVFKVL